MSAKKDVFVSVIAIADSSVGDVESKVKPIAAKLDDCYSHSEIILLDSAESPIADGDIEALLKKTARIRHIRLFRNVPMPAMTAAGLENAIGDVMVVAPIEFISETSVVESVQKCLSGFDVVCGTGGRASPLYRLLSSIFRKLFGGMLAYNLPKNDVGFRCVSRRILNAAMLMPRFHQFAFLRLSNAGGECCTIDIPVNAVGRSGRTIRQRIAHAVSMIIYNSVRPLRLMNLAAIVTSAMCALIALYTFLIKLFKTNVVEGWTTIMLVMSFLFLVLFIMLAFIGEYIARLVQDGAVSSQYSVLFERNSSVMLDAKELNVMTESEVMTVNNVQTGRNK